MDSSDSDDTMLCTYRITGRGRISTPVDLRASRSQEHRAPVDAQLRLFPAYEKEDDTLARESLDQDNSNHGDATKRTSVALQYANQASRELLADINFLERKKASENAHRVLLAL